MFKVKDLIYLNEHGLNEENLTSQTDLLNKTDCYVNVDRPASIGDGIVAVNQAEKYIDIFNNNSKNYNLCKFVPASGAATRMFKRMIAFCNNPDYDINEGGFYSVKNTIDNIDKFAFYNKLKDTLKDINDKKSIIENILYDSLNYANLPKGLIDFHVHNNQARTSFEEHIHEALCMSDNPINIHFTVSEEHLEGFKKLQDKLENDSDMSRVKISFSFQDNSTDTIAIYKEDASYVRNSEGHILLRPGGHGALIKNLNELEADIVFIKNIDNVIHPRLLDETISYKKLLGGVLIDIKQKIDNLYNNIDNADDNLINEAKRFLKETFNIDIPSAYSQTETVKYIKNMLDKPIRVCGMVKNAGEPGGGPFWVKNTNGESLQIIEKAQINSNNSEQLEIMNKSTHFNPVDLVCCLKKPDGTKFDLNNYVDPNTAFVSEKTYNGKAIKVLERPGLWNGAMANWLTVFVDVPLITFNPVKEINDLLRKEHLPN